MICTPPLPPRRAAVGRVRAAAATARCRCCPPCRASGRRRRRSRTAGARRPRPCRPTSRSSSPDGTPRSSTSRGVVGVRPVHEHARVAAGHEEAHPHRLALAVRERTRAPGPSTAVGPIDRTRGRGGARVLPTEYGQRDGAALAAQRDPVAVGPVAAPSARRRRGRPRPATCGGSALSARPSARRRTAVAVGRDDVDGDVVVLLDREGDAGAVLAPVGVRREEADGDGSRSPAAACA